MNDWTERLKQARQRGQVTIVDIEPYNPFGGHTMTDTQKKTEMVQARLTPAQKDALRDALRDGETMTAFIEDAIAAYMERRGAEYPRNAEGSGTYQKES